MTTLLTISFIYFLIGIIAFSLTALTNNNIFTKTIVKVFKTPQNFNGFMFKYWLLPIAAILLSAIIYSAINS